MGRADRRNLVFRRRRRDCNSITKRLASVPKVQREIIDGGRSGQAVAKVVAGLGERIDALTLAMPNSVLI